MKNVTVEYFAVFRDQAGCRGESVATGVATAGDLFDEVASLHGLERLDNMKVAVNDEIVRWSTPVNDGDRVLFFPPVSGG